VVCACSSSCLGSVTGLRALLFMLNTKTRRSPAGSRKKGWPCILYVLLFDVIANPCKLDRLRFLLNIKMCYERHILEKKTSLPLLLKLPIVSILFININHITVSFSKALYKPKVLIRTSNLN
jgi:hypothetical protein